MGFAGAMFLALGTTEAAQAITIFRGTGTEAANEFDAMKAAIGGANNVDAPPQAGGFRTINWDGVKLDGTDFGGNTQVVVPDKVVGIPEDRFLSRGTLYDEVYFVSGDGFESVNPGVAGQFPAFSPKNTFAHIGEGENQNEIAQSFTLAGTTTQAATRGFGAIFLDVEQPNTSYIEFFNGSQSLGKYFVDPAASGEPSFLGVLFDDPIVTNVELILGNGRIFDLDGGNVIPGSPEDLQNGVDLVAVDDFVYAEPVQAQVAVPEASSPLTLLAVGAFGASALLMRSKKRA